MEILEKPIRLVFETFEDIDTQTESSAGLCGPPQPPVCSCECPCVSPIERCCECPCPCPCVNLKV